MKIEEVPQDKGYLVEGRISDLCYVVDKDGHYTHVTSMGWAPKNDAIKLAWDVVYEKAEEVRQEVLAGKLSPIAFYMELNVMDVNILANYTSIPRRKVKRHLRMKGFRKLNPDQLSQYANALNVTADELLSIERIREIVLKHED
jgi:hypothetical protein